MHGGDPEKIEEHLAFRRLVGELAAVRAAVLVFRRWVGELEGAVVRAGSAVRAVLAARRWVAVAAIVDNKATVGAAMAEIGALGTDGAVRAVIVAS